ncbi:hypothetical protein V8E53_007424 [Lactarius tabidus]
MEQWILSGTPRPQYHPLIKYLAELWEATSEKTQVFNDIQLRDIVWACEGLAKQHPETMKLYTKANLTALVSRIPAQNQWWLPPLPLPDPDAESDADKGEEEEALDCSDDQAYSPTTPKKDNDDTEGYDETPRRLTRSARQAVVGPKAQNPLVAQRPKINDSGACGPCDKLHRKCQPIPLKPNALLCLSCTSQQIDCYPIAGWAKQREAAHNTEQAGSEAQIVTQKAKVKISRAKQNISQGQSKLSRGKPEKHSMFDLLSDILDVRKDILAKCKEVTELCEYLAMHEGLPPGVGASSSIKHRPVRIPATVSLQENALPHPILDAAAHLSSLAIPDIPFSSTNVHFNLPMVDGLLTQTTKPLVAGSSAVRDMSSKYEWPDDTRIVEDEDALLDIAIWMDAAIREFKAKGGAVDVDLFIDSIDAELIEVNKIFSMYPEDVPAPKYHPLIEYLAEMWEAVTDKSTFYQSLELLDVARLCEKRQASDPNGKAVLIMADLTSLLSRVPMHDRCSDTGKRLDMADPEAIDDHTSPTSPEGRAHSTVTPEPDDEHMADPETPCRVTRAAKCAIIASPTGEEPDAQCPRLHVRVKRTCIPIPDKPCNLACKFCTNQKLKCKPIAKWAEARDAAMKAEKATQEAQQAAVQAEKEAQKSEKSAEKSTPDTSTLMAKLEDLQVDLKKEIAVVWNEVAAGQKEIAELRAILSGDDHTLRGHKQPNTRVPLIRVPEMLALQESTSPSLELTAATPSPSSAISNLSSDLSSLHLNSLLLDSLHAQITALPVAGISDIRREGQVKFIYNSVKATVLMTSEMHGCSTRIHVAQCLRARRSHFKATLPGPKCHWDPQDFTYPHLRTTSSNNSFFLLFV